MDKMTLRRTLLGVRAELDALFEEEHVHGDALCPEEYYREEADRLHRLAYLIEERLGEENRAYCEVCLKVLPSSSRICCVESTPEWDDAEF